MEDLYHLLSKGGIIVIDEHLVGAETEAIKEFTKKKQVTIKLFQQQPGP